MTGKNARPTRSLPFAGQSLVWRLIALESSRQNKQSIACRNTLRQVEQNAAGVAECHVRPLACGTLANSNTLQELRDYRDFSRF